MSRVRPRKAARLLRDLLIRHPWLPSLALFRAIELHALLDAPLAAPLLDLGCGDGGTTAAYFCHRPVSPAVGLELNVAQAQRAFTSGLYQGCVSANAEAMALPAETFGSVLSVCVIEHIPHQERVLAEASRVLRPGGMLVFTTVSPEFLDNLAEVRRLRRTGRAADLAAYVEKTNRRLEHFHYRPLAEWQCLLEAAGLELVEHRRVISPAVARLWSRLDDFFTEPVRGRDRFVGLRRGRLRRWLWRWVGVPLFQLFLLPWVLADGQPEAGSVILLAARKPLPAR